MVEIGPGLAALTQPLVERLGRLTVIELDRDLAARLRTHPQLQVIESDVLKVDFTQLARHCRPPGCKESWATCPTTSPLRSCSICWSMRQVVIVDQHFMLQKEVVDRMVAAPSTSDYGRLSVMLQWRYAMDNVLFVPPDRFDPPPRWTVRWCAWCPGRIRPAWTWQRLSEIVQVAFSQRRKILRHTLGRWLTQKGLRWRLRCAAARRGSARSRVRRAGKSCPSHEKARR
jgi:16S rRNA (adenine1518-N6/adenine1519-N6)-dimethyltransferase